MKYDRTHPGQGGTNGRGSRSIFGYRGIDNAISSELFIKFFQACASVPRAPHSLTNHKYARVGLEQLSKGLAHRLRISKHTHISHPPLRRQKRDYSSRFERGKMTRARIE